MTKEQDSSQDPRGDDKPKEACGIFGVYGHSEAAVLTFLGLHSLQHRGEESAGIVSSDGKKFHWHREMGLVHEVFDKKNLRILKGDIAIGHTRYSTTGSSRLENAQPIAVKYARGHLAVAHNGNLVNAKELRDELDTQGAIFQSGTDSEIIVHLMAKANRSSWKEALLISLRKLQGAYTLVMMTKDSLVGVRDPHGWRPLCLGQLDGAYFLASESCALDIIGAKFIREVEPGEVVIIDRDGFKSLKPFTDQNITPASCIFELIYFARPDSLIFGESVQLVRERLGQQLALEHPVEADLVMSIPDSGNPAALGFSHQSGIQYALGMTRSHYIGRTFIQPSQEIRDFQVKVKFNPISAVLKGKRIVVVDDSIVRGTTSQKRIRSLREAGAKEVHLRISCPPIRHPCFFGIDFPNPKKLIAFKKTVEEIGEFIGVDSLGYLSLDGMLSCVTIPQNYCTACFSGQYPIPVNTKGDKLVLER